MSATEILLTLVLASVAVLLVFQIVQLLTPVFLIGIATVVILWLLYHL